MATTDPAYRYAMAKYAANGSQTDFVVNFDGGAIHATDIAAFSYVTADYSAQVDETVSLISSNADFSSGTARIGRAVPAGRTVVIYRLTARGEPLVDFINRSMLTELNLNTITKQAIFSVAELLDAEAEFELKIGTRADAAVAASNAAVVTANAASTTANTALTKAQQAFDKGVAAEAGIAAATTAANAATASANAANQAASDATILVQGVQGVVQGAVDTANAAAATAQQASDVALGLGAEIDAANDTANTALSQVGVAVAAANNAVTTANAVDGKAQTALDNAAAAVITANAASAGVSDKVSKTVTADQRVVSNFLVSLAITAEGSYIFSKDRPSSATDVLVLKNKTGTVATYAGISVDAGGISLYDSAVSGDPTNPGASVRVLKAGSVAITGALNLAGTFLTNFGAVGSQQFMRRCGWTGGLSRYAEVMETNSGMSYYTYDASGGTPVLAMQLTTQNSGGTKPMLDVRGQLRAGGQTAYTNGNAVATAHVVVQGQFPCLVWQDNVTSGNVRAMYFDPGTADMVFYNVTTAAVQYYSGPTGFRHIGGFQVLSDERTKYMLKDVKPDWDAFMAVTPQTGKYRKHFGGDGRKRLFLVAQDVKPHYPSLVTEQGEWDGVPDMLAIDYDQGVPLLWAMIQDLRKEVLALKEQLNG